jgi:hypothetical protein
MRAPAVLALALALAAVALAGCGGASQRYFDRSGHVVPERSVSERFDLRDSANQHASHVWWAVDAGLAHAPGTATSWRVDPSAGFSVPIRTRGGGTTEPAPRTTLSIRPGLGFSIDARQALAIRPELALTLLRQDTMTRPASSTFATTPPWTIALAVAALFPADASEGIRGGELSLGVHIPPFGGIFVRGGYEASSLGTGATWMLGARFDNKPAKLLFGAAAAAVLAYAAWKSGVDLSLDWGPTGCKGEANC